MLLVLSGLLALQVRTAVKVKLVCQYLAPQGLLGQLVRKEQRDLQAHLAPQDSTVNLAQKVPLALLVFKESLEPKVFRVSLVHQE